LNVYFIMPLPGSQRFRTVDIAYFLHTHRWHLRILLLLAIAAGIVPAFRVTRRWVPALFTLAVLALVWVLNFEMAADHMFRQPGNPVFRPRSGNQVDEDAIVIGVEHHGEARAYPIRFLVYHHQVQDTVGGNPIIVTYCSVCRTGRVFEPIVHGVPETFRLVGMDHFNAMFEDATTRSWWRQSTGEAIAGPSIGATLPEFDSTQTSLRNWFELHPDTLVMQPDEASRKGYDKEGKFERGENKGKLTKTNRSSWQDKSWVIGIQVGTASKAYDWNRLVEQRIINDQVGAQPIVLALAKDGKSFAAYARPADSGDFAIQDDTLSANGKSYDLSGRDLAEPSQRLPQVRAYQEFWHSWRTFHPETQR
jgi:hypothetical protein